MKKLFLVSILSLLTSYVLAGVRETPTDTSTNSICVRKSLNLKMKMQEIDKLIAKSESSKKKDVNSKSNIQ